jgi:CRP-like cAMP-binding protein
MTPTVSEPPENQLLTMLPPSIWRHWRSYLEKIDMSAGQVVCGAGLPVTHVFFPTTAIVALTNMTRGGNLTQVAVVGNECVVGISAFLGGQSTINAAAVQIAGEGWRVEAAFLRNEFEEQSPVKHLLLRYTQALITQMAQTAVCNRYHTVEQQLCRWLLHIGDRLHGNVLLMTHEDLANALGVRREGVTESALALQRDGIIRYSRGHITVLNRTVLEQRVCECYGVVRKEYDRLLPSRQAT